MSKRHDLNGLSIMTPRGEAFAQFMFDYGDEQESVFYCQLVSGEESLLRFPASQVRVKSSPAAEPVEPNLRIGHVCAALGPDHGFSTGQLTRFIEQVNTCRGVDEPRVWMPYYRFMAIAMTHMLSCVVAELHAFRRSLADDSPWAKRLGRLIAVSMQRMVAVVRLGGVGPRPTDPDYVKDAEVAVKTVLDSIGTLPSDPLIEEVARLRKSVAHVAGELRAAKETLATEAMAAAVERWGILAQTLAAECDRAVSSTVSDVLGRAG